MTRVLLVYLAIMLLLPLAIVGGASLKERIDFGESRIAANLSSIEVNVKKLDIFKGDVRKVLSNHAGIINAQSKRIIALEKRLSEVYKTKTMCIEYKL